MDVQKIIALLFVAFAFLVEGNIITQKKEEKAVITEDLIRRELGRFASVQDVLEKANLNLTVVLSHKTRDENGTLKLYDEVTFQPLGSKYDPKGPQVPEETDEAQLAEIFKFAAQLNMTSIASREYFREDGSLRSRSVFLEDVKMFYKENGNSHILIDNKSGDMDENSFDQFVSMCKHYALPVEAHKTLYNKEGEIVKTDTMEYKPKKVTVVSSEGMPIERIMFVAEAVKTAEEQKYTGNDKVDAICRLLSAKFSWLTWNAVMGDVNHFSVKSDEWVKVQFEGETYVVWGSDTED